ncbi:MAG TPA: hypothetical protein VMR31_09805 [Myxococcota bacterium]|nr:hypothetical protein [Myxococcota bacterium]
MATSGLRAGDWIEIRSREEILATLDADGRLAGMPFMPEMLAYCGRRARVYKSAHKSCDTIKHWEVMRQIDDAVHLEGLRCNGSSHGGCQAACLLYWHTAWLRPVDGAVTPPAAHGASAARCTAESLAAATQGPPDEKGEPRYRCQATLHHEYSRVLDWRDPRAYWRDFRSGNFGLGELARYGLRALYNTFARHFLGGRTRPRVLGLAGEKTPTEQLELKPGDLVRVKPEHEIMKTIDAKRKNRGLTFDVEMTPFCGKTFRVLSRVEKIVDERTGRMLPMPRDCIVLDGVFCGGCLSQYRMFCPRSIYPYWREIWLERVE